MRPLIFLDFDDVLATSREYSSFQVMQMLGLRGEKREEARTLLQQIAALNDKG